MESIDRVWTVIPSRAGGWATAAAIADTVGLGRDTTGRLLRQLVAQARVNVRRRGRVFVYQQRPTIDVQLPPLAGEQLETYAPQPERVLWVSIWRRGLDHHLIAPAGHQTLCGRSTVAGGQTVAEPPPESSLCPRCAAAQTETAAA